MGEGGGGVRLLLSRPLACLLQGQQLALVVPAVHPLSPAAQQGCDPY